VPARRLEIRIASPPIDVGQDLPGRVRDEVRAHEPQEPVANPLREQQALPAPRHGPDGAGHDRHGEEEPAEACVREDLPRLLRSIFQIRYATASP
jgi:hypothetical protein